MLVNRTLVAKSETRSRRVLRSLGWLQSFDELLQIDPLPLRFSEVRSASPRPEIPDNNTRSTFSLGTYIIKYTLT